MKFLNYCDWWSRRNAPLVIDNAEATFTTSALPGVGVMKAFRALSHPGDTEAMKAELLFQVYVQWLHKSGWTWAGGGSCGSPLVLDNPPGEKECQAFAVGLKTLMIAPWPFGLGIAEAGVTVTPYSGPLLGGSKVGFVSLHPTAGVLNLKPNVTRGGIVDDDLGNQGLYRWDNHKVVLYGGKYFDPSYGCQYLTLADMAYQTVVGFGLTGGAAPATYDAWDLAADNDQTGNYYLVCRSALGRQYHLKVRKLSLRPSITQWYDGPVAAVVG